MGVTRPSLRARSLRWSGERAERRRGRHPGTSVGVGPWQGPWPDDPRYDPELLRDGDRRNVADRYRYWTVDADPRRPRPPAGTASTWRSRTGRTTSTSGRWSGPRTRSTPPPCTWWAGGAGTAAARWSPTGTSTSSTTRTPTALAALGRGRARRGPAAADRPRQRAGRGAAGDVPAAAGGACCVFGQEGPGLSAEALAGVRRGARHRPVRLDPLAERRCRRGDRHARVDPRRTRGPPPESRSCDRRTAACPGRPSGALFRLWLASARERVVVIGADAAGMSAAHQALRTAQGRAGASSRSSSLEGSTHTSYSACGIPYWIAGDVDERRPARRPHRRSSTGRSASTCGWRPPPSALDLDARTVTARSGRTAASERARVRPAGPRHGGAPAGAGLGAGPGRRPGAAGCAPLKTLDDGAALGGRRRPAGRPRRRRPRGRRGRRLHRHRDGRGVRPARPGDHARHPREVMSTLDPDMGARVRAGDDRRAASRWSAARRSTASTCGPTARVAAVRSGGDAFPADVVALGLGVTPATELAAGAGPAARRVRRPAARRPPARRGRRLGRRRLLRVARAAGGPPGVRAAGHARQQAGPGRGGEPRGRRRPVRRRRSARRSRSSSAGGAHVEVGRTGPDDRAGERRRTREVVSLVTESTTTSGYMPQARADRRQGARPAGRPAGRRADRRRAGLGQAHRHRRRRALVPASTAERRGHGPGVRAAVLAGVGPRADRLPAPRRPAGLAARLRGTRSRCPRPARGRIRCMPIATPEAYAEMLDTAKARVLRLPGHQRDVVADAERRASAASPRPRATASCRCRPAARSTCRARA